MAKAYFLLIGALLLLALAIGGYAFYKSTGITPQLTPQYSQPSGSYNVTPPSQSTGTSTNPQANQITLTITSPKNGTVLSIPTAKITGKTAPNADVSVNDVDLKADAQGNFTSTVSLEEGDNEIIVTATDDTGAVSEASLTLTYTPATSM